MSRAFALAATMLFAVVLVSPPGRLTAQDDQRAIPRTSEGRPDFSGIWRTLGAADYDLEPHGARKDAPPGLGIVEGGTIPYQPSALERRKKNFAARVTADPRSKCFTLGTPRAQVEKLMGNARAGGKLGDVVFGRVRHLEVRNPQREERVTGPDGAAYDVLFYYTDVKTRDDRITDDELTPLVFRGHELAGIGYGFLGKLAPKYAGLQ